MVPWRDDYLEALSARTHVSRDSSVSNTMLTRATSLSEDGGRQQSASQDMSSKDVFSTVTARRPRARLRIVETVQHRWQQRVQVEAYVGRETDGGGRLPHARQCGDLNTFYFTRHLSQIRSPIRTIERWFLGTPRTSSSESSLVRISTERLENLNGISTDSKRSSRAGAGGHEPDESALAVVCVGRGGEVLPEHGDDGA